MSTLRIAHASDLHCCERNRLDDWKELHRVFVEQVGQRRPDLALLTGDLFHARSTPAERNAMAGFVQDLAAECPVVIVKGNHDAAGDLDIFGELESLTTIHVIDRPGTVVVETEHGEVAVIGLPWFDKAHLVAGLEAATDAEQTRQLTIDAAQQLLAVLRAHTAQARDMGYVPILAGHVMVAGAETSTGQTLIGTTVELSPGDIRDVGCEYAALGHIHKRQDWYDGRVAYSGSTWRQNFGEAEAKGWNLVTIEDGRFSGVEFVELPARRIVLLEADCTGGILSVDDSAVRPGDLVRYRYRVRPEDLATVDEGAIRRALEAAGAAEVKLEAIVEQETRVRSEAIASATSAWEKVEAWLDAKQIDLAPEARATLKAKCDSIEARLRQGSEVAA